MTEANEKIYDQTYLRENRDGYRPHRDYAAHYFRWGWATSRTGVSIAGRSTLDIGCGPDLPLINVATYKSQVPSEYVGVDLNPLGKKLTDAQSKRITLYGKTDFTEPATWEMLLTNHGKFNRIVCFECIEHMPKARGWQLLWGARQLLSDAGEFYLSTPVLDKKPAHNHVYEYGVEELRQLVEAADFEVIERYGTFANVRESVVGLRKWLEDKDYDPLVADEILDALGEYYSPDVLATFVAPLIPDHSRNNLWRLRLAPNRDQVRPTT